MAIFQKPLKTFLVRETPQYTGSVLKHNMIEQFTFRIMSLQMLFHIYVISMFIWVGFTIEPKTSIKDIRSYFQCHHNRHRV